ncbi:MAG TPA: DUF1015 domain-containing protein [Acidimicrobiales bacterium]|nr:DUF1015 domain-containing protein [Acidimicrobiales bacterium]
MPRFEAFTGLRYSHSHIRSLDDVVCPPYDVISEPERVALEARSPNNIVRLELPVDDVSGPGDRYQAASTLLDGWRDGGILHRDPAPAFYGYRMTFTDPSGRSRTTLGVIGALGLEPPGRGILPHEETTPKAKTDRLDLLRATRANLSPIWGLSPYPGLSELLEPPEHPADHATDDDRVLHELWPVTDAERIAAISKAVESEPVVIADGHHRYETALNYRAEREAAGAAGDDESFVMALVVELSEEQLTVQAIHRLVSGLPPGTDVVEALSRWFDITPTEPADRTILTRMDDAGALAVLTPHRAWLARPNPELVKAATHDLDSSRLDVALAALPGNQVIYQHGWDNAAAAVATGQADVAVLLRPPPVAQIAAISRGGVRMPPKTTFFWPKPRTGMAVRELLA